MVVLSGKERHSKQKRFGFFFGGLLLILVSLYTVYASAIYNNAIATSNTELITNAVIILFIADIDEMAFAVVMTVGPVWSAIEEEGVDTNELVTAATEELGLVKKENVEIKDDLTQVKSENSRMKAEVSQLQSKVESLHEKIQKIEFLIILKTE